LGGRGRWISEFKASLVYRVSSRTARAIQRNPVSKKKKKKKKKKNKTNKQKKTPNNLRKSPPSNAITLRVRFGISFNNRELGHLVQ
jgi:hypothetical protein